MSNHVSIQSRNNDSKVVISPLWDSSSGEHCNFNVTGHAVGLDCSFEVYGYMPHGHISEFFAGLDRDMLKAGGWQGSREWSSLEGEFSVLATSDRLGHVWMIAKLRANVHKPIWKMELTLELEANQLTQIATDVRNAFSGCAT